MSLSQNVKKVFTNFDKSSKFELNRKLLDLSQKIIKNTSYEYEINDGK